MEAKKKPQYPPSATERSLMKHPAASSGVSSSLLDRHSVLDTESSRVFWIPAFAGMTNSRQAAGNAPEGIQIRLNVPIGSVISHYIHLLISIAVRIIQAR
jgi:hypothetical protein